MPTERELEAYELMAMRLPGKFSIHAKSAVLIGFITFFSFAYFYEGGGWNQNSRFDLLRAIVEKHTLRIDDFHENTGDKAHFQGHYYSDKAPGAVFLAVPFAVVARAAMRTAGVDPESARGEYAMSYLVSLFAVALPTALGTVCLFFVALRWGGSVCGAAFAALVMALGTPVWAYASLFWAHALVGACLVFAFAAALRLGDETGARAEFVWALAVGVAAGWATVTEYPAAPASAILAVFALSRVWARGSSSRWRVVAGVGLVAGLCAMVLMAYLHAAFGSFRPSYAYYDPSSFTFMHDRGYLGLTYPHIEVVLKLLFGSSRGLFFAAPVVLAAPLGIRWLWQGKTTRGAAIAITSIVAYYFLFNATFYEWRGGRSYGPRYAGAAIPLLCLGLAVAWDRANRPWRNVMVILALCGLFSSLMVISTTSELAVQDRCPVCHQSWPAFWSGQVALNRGSMLAPSDVGESQAYGAFNLGELLGLRGLVSLIPLFAIWGTGGFLLMRLRNLSGALTHEQNLKTQSSQR
jgi:hypothetical protein